MREIRYKGGKQLPQNTRKKPSRLEPMLENSVQGKLLSEKKRLEFKRVSRKNNKSVVSVQKRRIIRGSNIEFPFTHKEDKSQPNLKIPLNNFKDARDIFQKYHKTPQCKKIIADENRFEGINFLRTPEL